MHLLNGLISTSTLVQHITGLFEIETEEEISKREFQEHEDTQTIRLLAEARFPRIVSNQRAETSTEQWNQIVQRTSALLDLTSDPLSEVN